MSPSPVGEKVRVAGMRGKGFTLIELLVGILIIGILAAVALPQYQKAVVKARFANIKKIISVIKNAQEIYYAENGTYITNISRLPIDIPCRRTQDTSVLACDDYFLIDNLYAHQETGQYIRAGYCPGKHHLY